MFTLELTKIHEVLQFTCNIYNIFKNILEEQNYERLY